LRPFLDALDDTAEVDEVEVILGVVISEADPVQSEVMELQHTEG
jgi:hypothetical protein